MLDMSSDHHLIWVGSLNSALNVSYNEIGNNNWPISSASDKQVGGSNEFSKGVLGTPGEEEQSGGKSQKGPIGSKQKRENQTRGFPALPKAPCLTTASTDALRPKETFNQTPLSPNWALCPFPAARVDSDPCFPHRQR